MTYETEPAKPIPTMPSGEAEAQAYLNSRGIPAHATGAVLAGVYISKASGGGSPWGMSRHNTARTCGRQYAFRYGAGAGAPTRLHMKPEAEPEARFHGTLGHLILAYHEALRMPTCLRPAWASERIEDVLAERAGGRVDIVDRLWAQFPYYNAFWSVGDQHRDTLAVELPIELKIRDIMPIQPEDAELDEAVGGLRVSGAIDRLVYDHEAQKVDIIDYKYTGAGWGRYDAMSKWTPSVMQGYRSQALVYLYICRHLGIPVRSFLIRRIFRNRKAPVELRDRPGWFDAEFESDENPVSISPLAYAEVPQMLYQSAVVTARVERALARGEALAPNYSACVGRYGACDYMDVCHAESPKSRNIAVDASFVRLPTRSSTGLTLSSGAVTPEG
jgi:hypothetical protein